MFAMSEDAFVISVLCGEEDCHLTMQSLSDCPAAWPDCFANLKQRARAHCYKVPAPTLILTHRMLVWCHSIDALFSSLCKALLYGTQLVCNLRCKVWLPLAAPQQV
jgi:heme A synthase